MLAHYCCCFAGEFVRPISLTVLIAANVTIMTAHAVIDRRKDVNRHQFCLMRDAKVAGYAHAHGAIDTLLYRRKVHQCVNRNAGKWRLIVIYIEP